MKRWQVSVVLVSGLIVGALGMRVAAPMLAPAVEKPLAADGDDAGTGVHVEPAVQKQAGLAVAAVAERRVAGTADGYARAVDPAPLGVLAAEIASATAAHTNSALELARLTALVAADAGASRHDLDAVRAQEGADRARLTLACQAPTLQIGAGLGHLGCAAVARLADQAAHGRLALIRLDFPDGPPPAGATVTIDFGTAQPALRVLGPAIGGDTQLQTAGALALLEGPLAAQAGVGRVVPAHRQTGSGTPALLVPRDAVVRADGALQVYRALAGDRFERLIIDGPGTVPAPEGWLVAPGAALKPGDRIVVAGAGTLLGLERAAGAGAGSGGGD
ncbi:hypothetical protein [Novosphingobium sp.]|uniref:hypothetical protein n=1 Tax=Novosphingobium sp. TaxID=1874826 RepID=UPI00333E3DFA